MLLTNLTLATMTSGYGLIEDGAILISGGEIAWAGPRKEAPAGAAIDCGGRLATPGLIDCHTHLVHGGSRANEFEMRLNGVAYADIARAGGGIMATVRETRAAGEAELVATATRRWADALEGTTWGGTAWSADGSTIFYVTADEQMRPCTVWRHRLGTAQADDVQVFHEPDERFYVSIDLTRSDQWVVIESASIVSSEVLLIPATAPDTAPSLVRPRGDEIEYSLDHWGDRWIVHTNLDAVDFRVLTAPLDRPAEWSELVPHVAGRRIVGVDAFADHLVLHEWSDAQPRLRVLFRDGTERIVHVSD